MHKYTQSFLVNEKKNNFLHQLFKTIKSQVIKDFFTKCNMHSTLNVDNDDVPFYTILNMMLLPYILNL